MAWRLAYALVTLRSEVNALAPDRSKVSDGTIGDPAHASRCSAHNPNNAGVVCGLDITHDPAGGFDAHAWADRIRRNPHSQCRYIISNGRIAGRSTGWKWHRYTGSNKHTKHIHITVGGGGDCEPTTPYDSITSWGVKGGVPVPQPGGSDVNLRTLKQGDRGRDVKAMQLLLRGNANQTQVTADGNFGPATAGAVKNVQAWCRLTVDGVVGPKTWDALIN